MQSAQVHCLHKHCTLIVQILQYSLYKRNMYVIIITALYTVKYKVKVYLEIREEG